MCKNWKSDDLTPLRLHSALAPETKRATAKRSTSRVILNCNMEKIKGSSKAERRQHRKAAGRQAREAKREKAKSSQEVNKTSYRTRSEQYKEKWSQGSQEGGKSSKGPIAWNKIGSAMATAKAAPPIRMTGSKMSTSSLSAVYSLATEYHGHACRYKGSGAKMVSGLLLHHRGLRSITDDAALHKSANMHITGVYHWLCKIWG